VNVFREAGFSRTAAANQGRNIELVRAEKLVDNRGPNIASCLQRFFFLENVSWVSNCRHGRERTYSSDCYILDCHCEDLDYNTLNVLVQGRSCIYVHIPPPLWIKETIDMNLLQETFTI
jgi:hypothetical protein